MRRQPKPPPSFPALLQAFFVEHLTQQRALSPQTVAAYRDAFMLFLGFAELRLGRSPAQLTLADITPDLIMAFLDHLERDRHNSVRSRNARLAALRSFLKFAAHRDVSSLQVIEHALGVPAKRFERPMLGYLSREEMLAVIGTPDRTWFSQRDHVLLLLLYNTGARVSEIVGVRVGEVVLDEGAACVHLHGNREGQSMSRWNVMQRLERAVQVATESCPDLAKRQITPHVIRHTTAMHLLQAGVDISVIALWLGHESPATTHQYVEADLAMKERALARLKEPETKLRRYRAPDSLIDFLRTL